MVTHRHTYFQIHRQTSSTHTHPSLEPSCMGNSQAAAYTPRPAPIFPGTLQVPTAPSRSPCPARLFKLKGAEPLNQLFPSLDSKGRSVIKTRYLMREYFSCYFFNEQSTSGQPLLLGSLKRKSWAARGLPSVNNQPGVGASAGS